MKHLFLIVSMITISLTGSFAKTPKWLEGTWEGTGYQIDDKSWSVEFSKNGDILHISYPSLGCRGNWTIVKAKKNRIDLREQITEGTEKCDQGCEVVIFKLNENQLSLVYSLPSYQKNAIATAVLVKK